MRLYKARRCWSCIGVVHWWQRQQQFETFGSTYNREDYHKLCWDIKQLRFDMHRGTNFTGHNPFNIINPTWGAS